ncbi:cytochrome P450 [Candidatus Poriferisodalis sp.]|uniref:cytochrome P450 n=1 Tax=Candidatus Poriferisodalis sp. TaxID=3101277 RepID=UPI003B02A45C
MSENTYHQQPAEIPQAPAGCPVHRTWSPLDDGYLADPYPIASDLMSAHPVFYAPEVGCVVVTEMADIEAVFSDHETFASTNVQDPVYPLSPEATAILSAEDFDPVAVMSNRPEPDHGRIRRHTRRGFSNRRIRSLEPYIRRRSHELIDDMIAAGPPTEFVSSFAFPLPGETIFRFIGFPESDDEMLKSWCGDRKAFSWGRPTSAEQVEIAENMLAYWRYCRDFTAHKRRRRGDDFASELIDAHEANPDKLSYREAESVIYGLSFAGHEAVTALVCNTLLCLLPRRDAWDAIRDDHTLIANAVEEVLRFNSSQISWRRIATRDTAIAGVDVPAGTAIFLNFASANRQESIFCDPDSFDIRRPNAGRHISFGKGVHYCLGANLAKLEAQTVTEILSRRLPSLELAATGKDLDYFPNITFRGPAELHLTW